MPKTFTPPSQIRFANRDLVAFKNMAMTVEVCVNLTSDHFLREDFYSGVIRFRRDEWKRFTVVWLYGDTVGRDVQEFAQPGIFDVSCSTYPENHRLTSPSAPATMSMIGSNFVSGTLVFVGGVPASSAFVDSHHLTFVPPVSPTERAAVPIRLVRPDFRTSSDFGGFSYELRPVITDRNPTGSWIDGVMPISLTGTSFKPGSNVLFTSGTASALSNNLTLESSTLVGFFAPPVPATGVYAIQIISPSGLISSVTGGAYVTVSFHRPEIGALLPFNTGTVAGSTPITVTGRYFLSGAQVFFGAAPVLSQSAATPFRIDVLAPPRSPAGQVLVTVVNPQDGQTSVGFPYQYVVPLPTIADVNFSGTSATTKKTGSAGSDLFITGTNFTGSDAAMTVTSVTLSSGSFLTASTNFTINSPFVIKYTIPALVTGSVYSVSVSNSAGTATFAAAFEYEDVPIITHISPNSGSVAGGTVVLIDGVPFYVGASVARFSGVLGTAQTVYTRNQMSAITPADANLDGGLVDVAVQNFGSLQGVLAGGFEYVPFPTASHIVSAKGNNRVPAETASAVTLIGSRFLASTPTAVGTTVQLSTQTGTIPTSFINSQQVSFNVQPHAPGFASLTATNRGITVSAPLSAAIEYVATPTLTSMSAIAVAGSGTTISLTGTNFISSADTAILVGTTQVAATVSDAAHLTFLSPALSLGTYQVAVINRATTVSNTLPLQYITNPQVTSLSVTRGPNTGGTAVVVNGVGFISGAINAALSASSPVNVSATLAVNFISPNQFSFISPNVGYLTRGATALYVSVLGLNAAPFTGAFTFEQQPNIVSLNPTTALVDGTTVVNISGTGFITLATIVEVDSVIVASTVFSPSSVAFTAPAHVTGTATVAVVNTFLSASSTFNYAPSPPPQISTIYVKNIANLPDAPAGAGGSAQNPGMARWQAENGGNAHPNFYGGAWADRLLGSNFTDGLTMVLGIIPFDGSPTMFTSFSFQSSGEIWFTMPPHVSGGQGYVFLSNSSGQSNFGVFRWNPTPTLVNLIPTFDHYLGTADPVSGLTGTNVSFTGTKMVQGETYFLAAGRAALDATVLNSYPAPGFSFALVHIPSNYDQSGDEQHAVALVVANSTSVPNEAAVTYASMYKTVNPPAMLSISPTSFPATVSRSGGIATTSPTYTGAGPNQPRLHWAIKFPNSSFVDKGVFPLQTSSFGQVAVTIPASPGSLAGTATVYDGYANELRFITGSGISFTYFTPTPISSITLLNTFSAFDGLVAIGFSGPLNITTTPWMYVTASGGVPPYTASLEFVDTYRQTGFASVAPVAPIEYILNPPGYIAAARWNGVINYPGSPGTTFANGSHYRWKVQDSIGQTAYSVNVALEYSIDEVG